MKVARMQSENGTVRTVDVSDPEQPEWLQGSLAEGFQRSGQTVAPGRLLAPLEPPLIIAIAQNYRAHALEMGGSLPQWPVFFTKLPGALAGPDQPIVLPRALRSDKVDYEAELAVVIGRTCRNVSVTEALSVVAGYTCANDVTARDWQKEWGGGQFCRGKGFDSFCPLGPWLVTPDSIGDPGQLRIRGLLNGELVQDSTTADLVFSIPELIAFLSGSTTLPAGTVILTGTPSGVGSARNPPRYLCPGDRFTVAIEGIGELSNPVAEEA